MLTEFRRLFLLLSLFTALVVASYFMFISKKEGTHAREKTATCEMVYKEYHGVDGTKELSNELILLAKEIAIAKRYTRSQLATKHLLNANKKLLDILQGLEFKKNVSFSQGSDDKESNELKTELLCPDIYMGTKFGYPYYQTGWVSTNCNAQPMTTVLTILLNMKGENAASLQKILKGIERSYPSMSVHIAMNDKIANLDQYNLTIKTFVMSDETHGVAWNKLMQSVITPYLLIGRDLIDFDAEAGLERQIRVAEYLGIDIVGGAIRKVGGIWSIGCRQFAMLNYTLAFVEGYDISRNSCLYCEYLNGPFVARTEAMKQNSFYWFDETSISKEMLFEDLFVRIKRNDKLSMICPDAMYYVKDLEPVKEQKSSWMSLVRKWGLNRIKLHGEKTFSYNCDESGLHCQIGKYKGLALPICCIEEAARGMNAIFQLCDQKGYICETDTGSLIGTLKLDGILPWDIDGDMAYCSKNHSGILSNTKYFADKGMTLVEGYKPGGGKTGYFDLRVSGWSLEMWGMTKLLSEDDILSGRNMTKVFSHGYYHGTMLNPGKVIRNRYGHEVYRHAPHWRTTGDQSSWINYKPGKFTPCPVPGHHACLDQFFGDGNIQFKGPWI